MHTPEFRVADEDNAHSLGFTRIIDGADAGSVIVNYRRGNSDDVLGMVLIEPAGWASVLAHTCKAPHDGLSYAAAKAFHEAEGHDQRDA